MLEIYSNCLLNLKVKYEDTTLISSSDHLLLLLLRTQLLYISQVIQGIIIMNRNENFAKEPELAKLLRRLKSTPVLNNKISALVFLVCL